MKVMVYSRKAVESLLRNGFPENTAVISFYDPIDRRNKNDYAPVDYSGKIGRVFYVPIYDIDIEVLGDFGLTYETYFPEVNVLAKFIDKAKNDGMDIICQCEYGQSRSAGCAAAILEHYEHRGIDTSGSMLPRTFAALASSRSSMKSAWYSSSISEMASVAWQIGRAHV